MFHTLKNLILLYPEKIPKGQQQHFSQLKMYEYKASNTHFGQI
jgi:hypothetical protein